MSNGPKSDAEYFEILKNARSRYSLDQGLSAGSSDISNTPPPIGNDTPLPEASQQFTFDHSGARSLDMPFTPFNQVQDSMDILLHPFKIQRDFDGGGNPGWKVNGWGSTITNGANGDEIDFKGLDDFRKSDGDVWVEIPIKEDLTVDTSKPVEIKVEVGGYADEVEFDGDGKQVNANLLIGRVKKTVVNTPDGSVDSFAFAQSLNSAQMLVHGFINGKLVRVFAYGPINPTSLSVP